MSLLKSAELIADVEYRFDWYVANAGIEVAQGYPDAVESTCRLLGRHSVLGPRGGFKHARAA